MHAPPHQKETWVLSCHNEMALLEDDSRVDNCFPSMLDRQATYAAVVSCSDCKTSAEIIFDAMNLVEEVKPV